MSQSPQLDITDAVMAELEGRNSPAPDETKPTEPEPSQAAEAPNEPDTKETEKPDADADPAEPEASDDEASSDTDAEGDSESSDGEPDADEPALEQLKVDGKIIEVTPEQKTAYAQMGLAAQKRMQAAAEVIKKNTEFFADLKKRPDLAQFILEDAGIDAFEFASEFLETYFRVQDMDPRDKDRWYREHKDKKEAFLKKKQEVASEEKEVATLTPEFQKQFDQELANAIKEHGIAQSIPFARRVLYKIIEFSHVGEELSPVDAVHVVNKELPEELEHYLSTLSPTKLLKVLGEKTLKAIRAADLGRVPKPTTPPKTVDVAKAKAQVKATEAKTNGPRLSDRAIEAAVLSELGL